MVFELEINDPSKNETNVWNSILFESQEGRQEQTSKILQGKSPIRHQLIANVDITLAEHPSIPGAEACRQVRQ